MKSLVLALTLFVITGTLAAFGLARAQHVPGVVAVAVHSGVQKHAFPVLAFTLTNPFPEAEDEEADEDVGPDLINAFYVTESQAAPATARPVVALRYD
jgi:hypothetical protein